MKKILSLFLFIALFVIITFLLFSDVEVFVEEQLGVENSIEAYALFSFTFLLSDIILPIPSSLIMILNGKVLGFMGGSILSLLSGFCSSSLGYFLGHKSVKYLNRFFSEREIENANSFFIKYGKLSVALSRGIPIISESLAVLSGTTALSYSTFALYSLVGHLVVSVVYAWVGAFTDAYNGHVITVIVVGITLILSWIISSVTMIKMKNANHKL